MSLPITMLLSTLAKAELTVSSPALQSYGVIPSKYTCDGKNVNPSLKIGSIPSNAKSLVIVVDDPDAAKGPFVHWLIWNIEPVEVIAENSAPGIQGNNDAGTLGYTGPCPPSATHHYHFKVYALDAMLDLQAGADRKALDAAMKNHIIGDGELVGIYTKAATMEG